ncbi:MAG: acetyl-CoA carboxylase biotin carboxyl carrier protein subunit, partial [Burkholderiaceae bacterium]|nr:acetyl-CoA carboxylase biotin carboxyl carrier protein subunit [Burkholderiaceae bacterium]
AVAGELRAPLAGRVVRVPFQAGAQVGQGDTLVVIESMKMEHALSAPFAGELAELNASVGDQVVAGRVLARVVPRELESALGSARAPVLSPDLNAVPGDRISTD